ncbi:MAG: AraC family transcriptional regulator [Chitinophagaceae bacterium]|nr:MAG: AraC family transcriptional regulator [Chitinophagaceae bacterium]
MLTNLKIKDIAAELGIADHYYFSRLFTKVMGASPNHYRKREKR